MEEAAASEGGFAHFPPGSPAPQAGDRVAALREPDRLAKLNAGKAEWYAKPLEERQRITAERQAARAKRAADREAKRSANGSPSPAAPPSVPAPSDDGPDTVRSHRSSLISAPPDSTIPRPGVRGGPLKGLLDLCEALPSLGDGTCFIQVSRVKPPVAFGIPCAGVQRPLWEPVDDAEFAGVYGGAEYVLRGYEVRENGRTKALTEPVTYKVAGPPNLESALTEEDAMRPTAAHVPNGSGHPGPSALRRPGLVTPHVATAEAEMHGRSLEHQEIMDDRAAKRAEERRRREEERERQERNEAADATRMLNERTEREVERTKEMYEERLREKSGGIGDVAELIKALQPQGRGEDTQALTRQHSAQIQQLTESNKQELLRLNEQHRHEVQRLIDTHNETLRRVEDQSRADRERADKLVRETEQRSNELVRAAEQRADARVLDAQNAARTAYDDLRTRSEERLRDQNQQWQQRFDDLKENHAREIRQKDSELNLMRTGLEGNMQVILAGKDTEIKRLVTEVRAAKEEAEKNKDFVGKLGEFERQAEALGFQKAGEGGGDGEGDDLKTTVVKGAVSALQNLPQIIDSASNAIRGARGGNPHAPSDSSPGQMGGQAARGHTRALPARGAPQQQQVIAPLTFATEDGGYVPPSNYQTPPVRRPSAVAPLEQSPTQPIITVPEQQLQLPMHEPQAQPAQHAAAPEQQQMSPAPQGMVPNQPPSMPPPPPSMIPPAPQPSNAEPLDPMTLGIIQGLAPDFAGAFTQRVQPQLVVEHLIANNGIENVRAALAIVTIDQVIDAMAQDQNPAHGVLRTRNGQKFLRAVWVAAEKAVS